MRLRHRLLVGLVAACAFAAVLPGPVQAASDCACRDLDHNGVCDPSDPIVLQSTWMGGGAQNLGTASFTIPETCDFLLMSGLGVPVQVTAKNIFIFGDVKILGNGGQGMLFIADGLGDSAHGNVVVGNAALPRVNLQSGGMNKLVTGNVANIAIAKASVGFKATGACFFSNAYMEAQPIAGSGEVGIQCAKDITFRGVEIFTSGFDIQSLTGKIDASNRAGGPPPDPVPGPCDANGDGIREYPCTLEFQDESDRTAFCSDAAPPPPTGAGGGVNKLRGVANPSVIIAGTDVDLGSDAGLQNLVEGRYAVTMVAENGSIDLTNAKVSNTDAAQSGSKIWVAADPGRVERRYLLKEKFYDGCTDQVVVSATTCFQSTNRINVCGVLTGTPSSTSPCRADVISVTSGGF
jgi:hypothetical protein